MVDTLQQSSSLKQMSKFRLGIHFQWQSLSLPHSSNLDHKDHQAR